MKNPPDGLFKPKLAPEAKSDGVKTLGRTFYSLWPVAMKQCIESKSGAVTLEEVRLAFVDEAKDAGFQIFGEWSPL